MAESLRPSLYRCRVNVNMPALFQLAKEYPGLMMKLLVKTTRQPIISFQVNNVTLQASGTVTAYAIQPNTTLAPLFILNMVSLNQGLTPLKNYFF